MLLLHQGQVGRRAVEDEEGRVLLVSLRTSVSVGRTIATSRSRPIPCAPQRFPPDQFDLVEEDTFEWYL